MSGYVNPLYARSLSQFGTPRMLARCGGWVLERPIARNEPVDGASERDAMGCYPLFCCNDWTRIGEDLAELQGRLVSLALVADPFGNCDEGMLRSNFDVVTRFKEHFLVDLAAVTPDAPAGTRHHRYYARKSLRNARVEIAAEPGEHLDEWFELYGNLIARHQLKGVKAFSREAFAVQLRLPDLLMFRMRDGDTTLGAHLWVLSGNVAYSHLMALNDAGYACRAAYGLYSEAIRLIGERFGGRIRWMDLGAGAGTGTKETDGLTQFKRDWSTGSQPAFFCGKILDRDRYTRLTAARGASGSTYFPAYRHGEFA